MRFSGRIEKLLSFLEFRPDDTIHNFSDRSFGNMSVEDPQIIFLSEEDNWSLKDWEILLEARDRQSEIHKKRIGK